MNDKSARLGRGLAALIGDISPIEGVESGQYEGIKQIGVEQLIANRANPRVDFDDSQLEDLAASIKEKGVMQPLLVRQNKDNKDVYEIIAGERRWRAAQRAGLSQVPVIVKQVDDKEALELAIIENIQRENLNSIEESKGYAQLIEQFNYTQADLAQVIGKSRSHIANSLRLLKLPAEVRNMIASGELTAGHARTLIGADNPLKLAKKIVAKGLSVRQAEKLSQQANKGEINTQPQSKQKDADTIALEKRLSDALGFAVKIDDKGSHGKLTINYKSLEQLDNIIARLLGQ